MKTYAPLRPPRRIAAPWLLAATMLAAGFATVPAAHAALVVTNATRSTSADTSLSAPSSTLTNSTSGVFNAAAFSVQAGPNGAFAMAELDSTINPLAFQASGQAAIGLANNASGQAESLFDVFFTLTTAFSYSGSAALGVDAGNAVRSAIFVLEEEAGTDIVNGSNKNPLAPFAGNLAPGNYHLLVRASAGSIDPNEGGLATFSFNLDFVDLDTPPAGVPEPSGLALAALAAVALRRTRRQR